MTTVCSVSLLFYDIKKTRFPSQKQRGDAKDTAERNMRTVQLVPVKVMKEKSSPGIQPTTKKKFDSFLYSILATEAGESV
jgi:hypothetical protein